MTVSIVPKAEPEKATASLAEWVLQKWSKPEDLIKEISETGGRISIEEMSRAAALVSEEPVLLARTYDLTRSADKAKPPLRGDLQLFALRVVALAMAQTDWLQDSEKTSGEELQRLSDWAKNLIGGNDATARKRAEQVLGIGLTVFLAKRQLAPIAVLELVGSAYGISQASVGDTRPERAIGTLLARSRPRQIAQFARISRLQDAAVQSAEAAAARSSSLLASAQKEAELTAAKLKSEQARSASLSTKVGDLEVENAALKLQLQSALEIGAHDLHDLKVRYRRLLQNAKTQASNATDALEIDPPKPEFSKTFLAQLLMEIDKEIAWLSEPTE